MVGRLLLVLVVTGKHDAVDVLKEHHPGCLLFLVQGTDGSHDLQDDITQLVEGGLGDVAPLVAL